MTAIQWYAASLLTLALVLFVWGRWRPDVVALTILVLAVAGGLVTPEAAFLGFGHPAVITVAAVLLLSRALETTGVVGALARVVASDQASLIGQVALFCAIGALLSGFINNVGALAILMPMAIANARRHGISPGAILMPLSFATMLGGMTTLIGTPPNIIVATYREEQLGEAFALLDFFPAGASIAAAGLLFLALIGWRLIPRGRGKVQAFEGVEEYIAELHLGSETSVAGQPISEVASKLEPREVEILGVLRADEWTPAISDWTRLEPGDVLIVEGSPKALANLQGWEGVSLGKPPKPGDRLKPLDTELAEVVLRPTSPPVGATAEELRMRSRYHVNLLGVSRQGERHFGALKSFRLRSGDVLLLQGKGADVADAISTFEALPLGDRQLVVQDRRAGTIAVACFAAALLAIGLRLVPPAIALAAAAVVLLLTGVVRPRNAYVSLDGPVLVVLGALLPVGQSLETSGVTDLIGQGLLALSHGQSVYVSLALIIVITMSLSDLMSNAATAVVMAPIALTVANGLGVNPDPFLMGVAIGASCAFLTPIGHQNNLLVMGPGGYQFRDYWRVGLPLEILVIATALFVLPRAWPF